MPLPQGHLSLLLVPAPHVPLWVSVRGAAGRAVAVPSNAAGPLQLLLRLSGLHGLGCTDMYSRAVRPGSLRSSNDFEGFASTWLKKWRRVAE